MTNILARVEAIVAAQVDEGSLDVAGLWSKVFPAAMPGSERGLDVCRGVLVSANSGAPDELEMLGGGFRVKLGAGISQALVTSAVLSGVLVALGFPELPPVVLPTILPLLFQIEHATLTRKDETILARLRLRKEVRDKRLTARELYDGLAEDIREQLSFLDFVDFLDHLDKAGLVDGSLDARMNVRDRNRPRLRVVFE